VDELTNSEKEKSYPCLSRIFGVASFQVRCVTANPGLSSAHMIFAPDLERVLREQVKERLWDAFLIAVSVRKKPKKT